MASTLMMSSNSRPPLDREVIEVAMRRRPADIVLTGGRIVAVQTGEILEADIAVVKGVIANVAPGLSGMRGVIGTDTNVHDVSGSYLLPGFFDGHLHPENSRLSPRAVSDALVPTGTTSIFSGLDHTAAASGRNGVRAALDEFADSPLKVFWGAPFRLPYTVPEASIGFPWTAEDHVIAQEWPEWIGVWELAPPWLTESDAITDAGVNLARRRGMGVFGSVPGAGDDLDSVAAHISAGLCVDHEAFNEEELLAKLRLGLFALLRDSPVERFLPTLIGLARSRPELSHRMGFCTDAFLGNDVAERGHISRLVREAVAEGIPATTAVQMATVNTARAYGVDHVIGSLTPGRHADIVICEDLTEFRPTVVFADGALAGKEGRSISVSPMRASTPASLVVDHFDRPPLRPGDFAIKANFPDGTPVDCKVIAMTDNAFFRLERIEALFVTDGKLVPDPVRDIALCAYINRFDPAGQAPGLGLVSGFRLSGGAIATSSSPDDENILCVGTNAEDMAVAVNTLIAQGGGDIIVVEGEVLAILPLPLAGIMSDLRLDEALSAQQHLHGAIRQLGCRLPGDPFLHLGILGITGVPEVGMSQHGLVEFATHTVVDVVVVADHQ